MKTSYFFRSAIIIACIAFSSFAVNAQTIIDGIAYTVIELNGANVAEVAPLDNNDTRYQQTSITIPSEVVIGGTTYPVKRIGDGSLREAPNLTTVVISEGVEIIGNSAFPQCPVLETVTIPSTVNSIEDWAFYGCPALSSINIPEGITAITEHTFQLTGLTSIVLPSSVTELKTCAFQDASKLASINLENITRIGAWALYGTAITSVELPKPVIFAGGETFRNCKSLETVVINETMSTGSWTFTNCENLKSVVYKSELGAIDAGAFSGCLSLTSFIIPNTVVFIDDWAFEKSGITKMYASWADPDGEVFIMDNAFGEEDGKINFTWNVPSNLISAYGSEWLGYPVEVGVPDGGDSSIRNNIAEKANVYYSNGNLNLLDMDGYNVSVIALDGRTVAGFRIDGANSRIPVSLNAGVYLLNAENGTSRATAKFVVR